MQTLRVLAVDDEALALRRLEIALSQVPNVHLVGKARSGHEALDLIRSSSPDVILLDIKMSNFGGFDVIDNLSSDNVPLVIFVTAFDEYATRAFEVSAIDYILKPVEFDRLRAALDKARHNLRLADADQRVAELRELVAALRAQKAAPAKRFETEFWAQRRGEFVRILIDQIDWIEAERDYAHLHVGGQSYMLRDTLSDIEARLDPEIFVRIRRSALVRIDRVSAIRKPGYGDFRVAMKSGEEVRVGRTYIKRIRDLLRSSVDN